MKRKRLQALVVLFFICVLALFPINCGGGGGGSGVTAPTGSATGDSTAQQTFRTARGFPPQFTLMFVTEGLDANGLATPLGSVRRIENWIYSGANVTSSLFDNGFFIREDTWGSGITMQATPYNPTQFTPGMNRDNVIALMGQPSCEETHTMAGRTITVMRYSGDASRPPHSVGLEDGQLSTVTAGFALRLDGSTSADLCS